MGRHFKAKSGEVFGMLTVVGWDADRKRWLCKCACGNSHFTEYGNMKNGHTTSCGCRRVIAGRERKTHGMRGTKLYNIWSSMKQRVFNPQCPEFKWYGGRGIAMRPEWAESFQAFAGYVNALPVNGPTLDRIDCNGDYDIGNLRWVTMTVQARNKTNNRLVEYRGETKTLAEWALLTGISGSTLFHRLGKLEWPVDKAMMTPVRGT